VLAVRISGWAVDYATGQTVPVVAVRAPDFADADDIELFELAWLIDRLRRLPRIAVLDRDEQDDLIREAISESQFASYAHLDPLPDLDLQGAGEITLMEAEALVEERLVEEVVAEPGALEQDFAGWLDTPEGRFASHLARRKQ
jgi:hypothetical protein